MVAASTTNSQAACLCLPQAVILQDPWDSTACPCCPIPHPDLLLGQVAPTLPSPLAPSWSQDKRERKSLAWSCKESEVLCNGIQPSRSKFREKNHSIIFNVLSHVCKISWPVLCHFSVKFSKLLNLTRKLPRHLSTEFRLIWLLMFNCRNQP